MVAIIQNTPILLVQKEEQLVGGDAMNKRPRRGSKLKKQCQVRFEEEPQTLEIPGRHGWTMEERSRLYFSKAEHMRMQLEIVDIVREYRLSCRDDVWKGKARGRLRGLEPITNHDDRERMSRLKGAISAVIQQQLNGEIDERWLSNVYRQFSEKASSIARKRATMDRDSAFSDSPKAIVMAR